MFPRLVKKLLMLSCCVLGIAFVIAIIKHTLQVYSTNIPGEMNYGKESLISFLSRKRRTGERHSVNISIQRITNVSDGGKKAAIGQDKHDRVWTSSVKEHKQFHNAVRSKTNFGVKEEVKHNSEDPLDTTLSTTNVSFSGTKSKLPLIARMNGRVRNQTQFSQNSSRYDFGAYKITKLRFAGEDENNYRYWNEPDIDRFAQFQEDWCRVREARLDWERYLAPCKSFTVWGLGMSALGKGYDVQTDALRSYISRWDLRPAGEFSRLFIQSVTKDNRLKTIGGDSWRVHFREGPSSFAPSVFDLGNGTYEVMFLVMEPGFYRAEIILDYTLCHGFKDPPPDWFKRGNSQGKNQPDGILQGDKPYLLATFRGGEKIPFEIEPAMNYSVDYFVRKLWRSETSPGSLEPTDPRSCASDCTSLLWDGFGRWTNGTWKQIYEDQPRYKIPRKKQGILWIFGDSLANNFNIALTSGPYQQLCSHVFTSCRVVYNWVYNMRGYWGDGVSQPREPRPNGNDYDHERVLNDVKEVLFHPEMDEKSVLFLNWGLHFAAAVNFTNYKRLIEDLIKIIKLGDYNVSTGEIRRFKGYFIWKTTTALNRDRFPDPHKDVRRFLTYPRVVLYNAYAAHAMCRAGLPVLDVYPLSDSYPAGTVSTDDPVHYSSHVLRSVENRLYNMFSSAPV